MIRKFSYTVLPIVKLNKPFLREPFSAWHWTSYHLLGITVLNCIETHKIHAKIYGTSSFKLLFPLKSHLHLSESEERVSLIQHEISNYYVSLPICRHRVRG